MKISSALRGKRGAENVTVIGTAEEINNVIQGISPGFPRQNLESIQTDECCYIINGTTVKIVIVRDEHDAV